MNEDPLALRKENAKRPEERTKSRPMRPKRVRRKARKIARNAYQREEVLTNRDCLTLSQRDATEIERAAAERGEGESRARARTEASTKDGFHVYREVSGYPEEPGTTPIPETRTEREPMVQRPEVHVHHDHEPTLWTPRHAKRTKTKDSALERIR